MATAFYLYLSIVGTRKTSEAQRIDSANFVIPMATRRHKLAEPHAETLISPQRLELMASGYYNSIDDGQGTDQRGSSDLA